jgi:TIR domain
MERDLNAPHEAFLSHSHVDAPFCQRLALELRNLGIAVWLDEDSMTLNDTIPGTVSTQIAHCRVFIVVLSPAAVRSKWVELETATAIALHKEIVVALAEPLEKLPDALTLLAAFRHIPFWRTPIIDGVRQIAALFPSTSPEKAQASAIAQWKAHTGPAFDADWSPDSETVATVGADGNIRIFSVTPPGPAVPATFTNDRAQWLTKVRWSIDGVHLAASGSDRRIWIWNVLTHAFECALAPGHGEILAMGWSTAGLEVVSTDGWITNVEGTTWLERTRAQFESPTVAAFGWGSTSLAMYYGGGQLEIIVGGVRHLQALNAETVYAMTWNRPNSAIAILAGMGRVYIINASQSDAVRVLETGLRGLRRLCWAGLSDALIVGDIQGVIHEIKPENEIAYHTLDTRLGAITSLTTDLRKDRICAAHENGMVSIWGPEI